MRFVVSHSGKQHAYQHAYSLQQSGLLDRFVTSTFYRPDRWPDRLAAWSGKADRFLRKRSHDRLDGDRVVRRMDLEIPEMFYRNVLGRWVAAENAMFRRDAKFDDWVARKYAPKCQAFWGFQGSCLNSLKAARNAGRLAVCEFSTAHVTAAIDILTGEAERHPEWAGTISNLHFPAWYRERLEQEPAAADRCIAASGFTRSSLMTAGVAAESIDLLPLGVDVSQFAFRPRSANGPLKVLFVGGIGQRKGIKYLLQAIEKVDSAQVQLQLLGPLPADETPLAQWSSRFKYLGRTDQAGVVDHMHRADVLVLPSVFEGFGLVIVEAMATGMPVITSTHSCGPEVIVEGEHGFVLRPDDVDGLADKIAWCAGNRDAVVEMGVAASHRAGEYSWAAHAERLSGLLASWDKPSPRQDR